MKINAIIVIMLTSLIFAPLSVGKITGIASSLFSQQISSNIPPAANFTYYPANSIVN